jgi:Xaa-Pro aminopeptidase
MENQYYQKRVAQFTEIMDKANIDAFLTMAASNQRYLTGFTGDECFLLIVAGEPHLIADSRYTTQAREDSPGLDVIEHSDQWVSAVASLLAKHHAHWVGFERERIPFAQLETIQAATPFATLAPTKDLVENMRMVKDATELGCIQTAGHLADTAFRAMLAHFKAGMTENEVGAELEYQMRKAEARGTAFPTIVGSGPRGAIAHAMPTSRVIQKGEPVVVDFGVQYEGYLSDCTRTIADGEPSKEIVDTYARLRVAQQVGLDMVRAGVSSRAVDTAVRAKLAEDGLGFGYGLGHSVGLEIHEQPQFSPHSDTTLVPGYVMTVEPGVYIANHFGMRIEDTVIVKENGCTPITDLGKDLVIVH